MKTVNLTNLNPVASSKMLADVQSGKMFIADYVKELEKINITSGWNTNQSEFVIDFGSGLKDPNGDRLTTGECLQVARMLIPTPLESAGNAIRIKGPLLGVIAGLICRVDYAADIIIESLNRTTGMIEEYPIQKIERDRVRLIAPDTNESTRDVGRGRLGCKTSQIRYYRSKNQPPFNYHGIIELVFIDTVERFPKAKVYDGKHYAWVDDLSHLEDVLS